MDTVVQLAHVLADRGSTNAGVALGAHVVAESHDHLLDLLGQLTSRGQNQGLAVPQLGVDLGLREMSINLLVLKILQ